MLIVITNNISFEAEVLYIFIMLLFCNQARKWLWRTTTKKKVRRQALKSFDYFSPMTVCLQLPVEFADNLIFIANKFNPLQNSIADQ